MPADDAIETFLSAPLFAVVGASNDRQKYGNKVLRAYQQHHLQAVPVHPTQDFIEGVPVSRNLTDLADAYPERPVSISMITPPSVTQQVVDEAIRLNLQTIIWMQPGAEHEAAITAAERAGIPVIARGPCVLVELPMRSGR